MGFLGHLTGHNDPKSIGAALAHKDSDRLVIDLQADGDALFTPSALWTAAHYRLPLLIVMENNRAYNNSVTHADRVAAARERPRHNNIVGTTIDEPPVDFSLLARAFGIHAEGPIDDPTSLRTALERALTVVVDERRPALVDVHTRGGSGV